jgi:hypothetical protein
LNLCEIANVTIYKLEAVGELLDQQGGIVMSNGKALTTTVHQFHKSLPPTEVGFGVLLPDLTPGEVWCGRGQAILDHRREIKEKTLQLRKQLYLERITA